MSNKNSTETIRLNDDCFGFKDGSPIGVYQALKELYSGATYNTEAGYEHCSAKDYENWTKV